MARRPLPSSGAEEADPIIEFCVEGVALSAQTKNRARLRTWQEKVASAARAALAESSMVDGEIEIRLSEFGETRSRDRDNVAKPIQDALQGILFLNDRQVVRLESEWCDIDGRYKVRFMSKVVGAALVVGREFVWIRIHRHRPREALIA